MSRSFCADPIDYHPTVAAAGPGPSPAATRQPARSGGHIRGVSDDEIERLLPNRREEIPATDLDTNLVEPGVQSGVEHRQDGDVGRGYSSSAPERSGDGDRAAAGADVEHRHARPQVLTRAVGKQACIGDRGEYTRYDDEAHDLQIAKLESKQTGRLT